MDTLRVRFLKGEQKYFLDDILKKVTLSVLSKQISFHKRTILDWKAEKYSMPVNVVLSLSRNYHFKLREPIEVMTSRWSHDKHKVAVQGGYGRVAKHGPPGTKEGRQKGGKTAIEILRKRGLSSPVQNYTLPVKFTDELAEYVGIMLGDGGLTLAFCGITLNSEADSQYIHFVRSLANNLFGKEPKGYQRKDSKAFLLYYNSVMLSSYLQTIGLQIGNKVKHQVGVPSWIRAKESFEIACLRGLMDTDGGVFQHKYTVREKEYRYKKIAFTNKSLPLLTFVFDTLHKRGFSPKLVANIKVWLYNSRDVELYLKEVGTHNDRLLKLESCLRG